MASTTVVSTRIPDGHARSLYRIAELRHTTVSRVLASIVVEQVAPTTDGITADHDNHDQGSA